MTSFPSDVKDVLSQHGNQLSPTTKLAEEAVGNGPIADDHNDNDAFWIKVPVDQSGETKESTQSTTVDSVIVTVLVDLNWEDNKESDAKEKCNRPNAIQVVPNLKTALKLFRDLYPNGSTEDVFEIYLVGKGVKHVGQNWDGYGWYNHMDEELDLHECPTRCVGGGDFGGLELLESYSERSQGWAGLQITSEEVVAKYEDDGSYSATLIGVTCLGSGEAWDAFQNCKKLKSVIFPNTLTTIECMAFSGCHALTTANLPDSLTTIGRAAFYSCYSLTSVSIPSGVTTIQYRAFWGCTGLTSLIIAEGVVTIEAEAFFYWAGRHPEIEWEFENTAAYAAYRKGTGVKISSLIFPSSLKTIHQEAFVRWNSLTSLTFLNGCATDFDRITFTQCSHLREAHPERAWLTICPECEKPLIYDKNQTLMCECG